MLVRRELENGTTKWMKTNFFSEDISNFEEWGPNRVQVSMFDPELKPFLVKEEFNSFEKRINDLEEIGSPDSLAENIAGYLHQFLTAEDETEDGEDDLGDEE